MSVRSLLPVLPLLAACTPAERFPSLLPRAAEAAGPDAPLPPVPPPRPADPAVAARIAEIVRAGQAGDAAFEAELPVAQAAVAAAGRAESEGWTRAQQAVSRLDASRGATVVAVADLDALAQSIGRDGERAADLRAIAEAAAALARLVQSQGDRLEALAGRLAPA